MHQSQDGPRIILQQVSKYSNFYHNYLIHVYCTENNTGLKICFAELSDKLSDNFEFGSDISSLWCRAFTQNFRSFTTDFGSMLTSLHTRLQIILLYSMGLWNAADNLVQWQQFSKHLGGNVTSHMNTVYM